MNKKESSLGKEIVSFIGTFAIAFCIAIIIQSTCFSILEVKQSSMQNTLFEGHKVIVNKLTSSNKIPKYGDIIIVSKNPSYDKNLINEILLSLEHIFKRSSAADADQYIVKRVIGLPGDTIDIRDGFVYRNGEKLTENYTTSPTAKRIIEFPLQLGADEVLVLGDNRQVSQDGRDFGPIGLNQIIGKVVYRIWPFNEFGHIE